MNKFWTAFDKVNDCLIAVVMAVIATACLVSALGILVRMAN